jgi:hypothetical protein
MSEVVGVFVPSYGAATAGPDNVPCESFAGCLEPKFQIHTRRAQPGGAMKTKIGQAIATFAETLIEFGS